MPQAFCTYMKRFLIRKKIRDVVEVGSGPYLGLASDLAPYCERFYSVNLPQDCSMLRFYKDVYKNYRGMSNIEVLGGNAMQLSKLVQHADAIILQNVLLDLTGEDTDLMWTYKRGGRIYESWDVLKSRFDQAEEQGYREFLKVANPGYVVRFGEPKTHGKFESLLLDKLKVDPTRIKKKELLYECAGDVYVWEAYIINNS